MNYQSFKSQLTSLKPMMLSLTEHGTLITEDGIKLLFHPIKIFFNSAMIRYLSIDPSKIGLLQKQTILDEFKIHPNNFALARAIAGDKSDNLEGVSGVGLKTIAKRFPFMVRKEESSCREIVTSCAMQGKRLKLHENIIRSVDLIKSNYRIMQLYSPNIRPINRIFIDNAIMKFEPSFSRLNFTKMLFSDDVGYIKFDELTIIMKKIKR